MSLTTRPTPYYQTHSQSNHNIYYNKATAKMQELSTWGKKFFAFPFGEKTKSRQKKTQTVQITPETNRKNTYF